MCFLGGFLIAKKSGTTTLGITAVPPAVCKFLQLVAGYLLCKYTLTGSFPNFQDFSILLISFLLEREQHL